jgi:hypothetical protein
LILQKLKERTRSHHHALERSLDLTSLTQAFPPRPGPAAPAPPLRHVPIPTNFAKQRFPPARRAAIDYYPRMKLEYPDIGSKWIDLHSNVERIVEVIRYDPARPRIRIACLQTQRLSWAKPERFNGKSGGYAKIRGR